MTFMRAALCTAHGVSARGREGQIRTEQQKRAAESLPLISLSITRYPLRRRKVIRISKSRFLMLSQVGRLWLAIRTGYIPGKILRKRLDVLSRVFA